MITRELQTNEFDATDVHKSRENFSETFRTNATEDWWLHARRFDASNFHLT